MKLEKKLCCFSHGFFLFALWSIFDVVQTFKEADLAGDGHISQEEWLAFVRSKPSIISYMTLPVLREVTLKYPSFLFNKSRP